MEAWLVWLIVAVLFAVGEIATLGFFLAPFAGGALVAALLAASGRRGVRAVGLVPGPSRSCCLLALRPLARSHKRMPGPAAARAPLR